MQLFHSTLLTFLVQQKVFVVSEAFHNKRNYSPNEKKDTSVNSGIDCSIKFKK